MRNNDLSESPTTELFVPEVLKIACDDHKTPAGVPCFHIPKKDGFGYYPGICNSRAWRAGMRGVIDPRSMKRGQRNAKRG